MNHAIVRNAPVPLGVECALPAGFQIPGTESAGLEAGAGEQDIGLYTSGNRGIAVRFGGFLFALLLGLGLWQSGHGLYIHAKARLAQVLIRAAWTEMLAGKRAVKPWPWADTWPVARLVLPGAESAGRGQEFFVLEGANGRSIAFGPGHMHGTPLPGDSGNSVIGGHRDTHFAPLRGLRRGDEIRVERADGVWRSYRVSGFEILDKRETWVAKNDGPTRLTLVTCWPFDAIRAGGSERYVVTALAVDLPMPDARD